MQPKINKLTIYLIKPEYQVYDEIIEDAENDFAVDGIGTFYSKRSHPHTPDWVKDFFGTSFNNNLGLTTSSAKGVFLSQVKSDGEKFTFALCFGFGRHLLKKGVVEDRFGLKVVLNSVDPKSLRSIDKTSLGSVTKQSREQITKDGIAADFGIDIEQDLVHSVTGKAKDARFGKTITGRDALSVSVKVDKSNIREFLELCIQRYKSKDYLQDFAWIDQITDVRDVKKVNQLDAELLKKIHEQNFDKVWMAVPEIVDWVEIKGFRYLQPQKADLKDDLDIQDFLTACGKSKPDITYLKDVSIYAISSKKDDALTDWSAFQCLYAEIDLDGKIYILNNCKWYEIIKDFTEQVTEEFKSITETTFNFPDYTHKNEYEYNKAVEAQLTGLCCMDRKVISYGGGHSKIEFCDLLTKEKKMIHVKRYGGSSHLSHLFSQGVVSGELFVADKDFRKKINNELPGGYQLADTALRPNAQEYEIVYAIIGKSSKPFDIPFFSKVNLRNARRRLEGYGYKVTIKKIKNALS